MQHKTWPITTQRAIFLQRCPKLAKTQHFFSQRKFANAALSPINSLRIHNQTTPNLPKKTKRPTQHTGRGHQNHTSSRRAHDEFPNYSGDVGVDVLAGFLQHNCVRRPCFVRFSGPQRASFMSRVPAKGAKESLPGQKVTAQSK